MGNNHLIEERRSCQKIENLKKLTIKGDLAGHYDNINIFCVQRMQDDDIIKS